MPKGSKYAKGSSRTGGYYGRFKQSSEELKFYDFRQPEVNLTHSQWVRIQDSPVLNMPQNTSESGRIGRKITIKGYFMRILINSIIRSDWGCRVVLVMDKQTNGAAMSDTDLFVTGPGGVNPEVLSFMNLANKDRFRIIHDEYVRVPATAAQVAQVGAPAAGDPNASNTTEIRIDINKRFNFPMEFNGTSGTLAEIRSMNLYCWVFVNKPLSDMISVPGIANDNTFNIEFMSRTRYLD